MRTILNAMEWSSWCIFSPGIAMLVGSGYFGGACAAWRPAALRQLGFDTRMQVMTLALALARTRTRTLTLALTLTRTLTRSLSLSRGLSLTPNLKAASSSRATV